MKNSNSKVIAKKAKSKLATKKRSLDFKSKPKEIKVSGFINNLVPVTHKKKNKKGGVWFWITEDNNPKQVFCYEKEIIECLNRNSRLNQIITLYLILKNKRKLHYSISTYLPF